MTSYAVTGSSGALGRLAVRELLARGVPAADIVALARTPSKAADLTELGIQVRTADYADQQTLTAALTDVDRLLLVSSSQAGQRLAHHTNVIEAAQTTGVSRIVYTSMIKADESTNPLAEEHRNTEAALRAATVPFTSVRNGWYTENYTGQLTSYLQRGEIIGATGSGAISAATRQDYAVAAVVALLQDSDGNQTYELGGPAFTLTDLAQVITEVTGIQVTYRDLPVEEYIADLQRTGLAEDTARFVATLDDSIAQGDLHSDSHDLADLLGRPPVSLAHAVREAHAHSPRE
ncbi:MAG: hypothetical protein QOH52_2817 [Pseudonocardiales bacterium]|jgi:NAD(P)H dehydrogenase (quinone)|nr:hypothetical protein [Pseudonocardiales bacterium]